MNWADLYGIQPFNAYAQSDSMMASVERLKSAGWEFPASVRITARESSQILFELHRSSKGMVRPGGNV